MGKDEKKAWDWYLKAALQGCRLAQLNLGDLYRVGRGVEKSLEMASFLYHAAARGDEDFEPARKRLALLSASKA